MNLSILPPLRLLAGLLLLLVPWGGLSAAQRAPEPPRPVEELMKEIRKERDDAGLRLFYDLARHQNLEAFEAFRKAVRWIETDRKLHRVYGYASHFYVSQGGVSAGMKIPVITWLREEAGQAPKTAARVGATKSLASFGEEGLVLVDDILRDSRQPAVRAAAAETVLPLLPLRNDAALLERILEDLPSSAVRTLATHLRGTKFPTEAVRPVLVPRVTDKRNPDALRVALLDILVRDLSEEVTLVLLELAERGTPPLQRPAIEALVVRGAQGRAMETVKKLLRSKLPDLRVAAIRALGAEALTDDDCAKKLFTFVRSKDPINRLGAVFALVELRTPEAIGKLYPLLADDDWHVRSATIEGIVALRREDAVPRLIERIDHETGRMLEEVTRGLQLLTGLDHGRRRDRWQQWWEDEGSGFRLPPVEDVRELLALREKRRSENISSATFYGIPVVSDRVCLVVDSSGSMTNPAAMPERSSTEGKEPTRFEVAVEELRALLLRIADGRWCNLIFFASDIAPWEDTVAPLDKQAREDLLGFVGRMGPGGGTNIFDALHFAFSDPHVDTIYLLSDGDPSAGRFTDPVRIREEIRRINELRRIRIHCISVGQRSQLLKYLAEDSLGVYREVGLGRRRRNLTNP